MMEKKEVRKIVRERKKQITLDERVEISRVVSEKAFDVLKSMPATKVALFLSMPDEVDTSHLIHLLVEQGKHTILVPRVEDDTTINFYRLGNIDTYDLSSLGIKEPSDDISQALVPEVMIVPGVAFDTFGGRVGRGRGYYDRYFQRYPEAIRQKIAIAYHLQVMTEELPMDPFDQSMDMLLTEQSSYVF
ncbi:5-formyltetrahydrofolate cyclo-ligase [Porphyromonas levii]|nr:5-formyltetrahydrofolate cyclo-ligase [Porphyromonas levii]MBR8703945.1 5-formyltetrahydrofolate cyclo-ligase [Porphyromonas levii]MBR8713289.1 5-formyltetrahydrofolate cyclo-ligase [Porphyromonas levii]MBR8715301.1 5-formyltetrahydrofolate cyclo-ligase [Porphyromonas levii]MBR8727827.1 5-formyltetrahydrofolate cyclo-ligase [Porphyromonas levii]MBR8729452.1 5-formyltetrahydrofolate cyclo-ligase [Porphyromonas levii]